MLTELNRIALVGIGLGCTSGFVQSILENYLAIKFDRQSIDLKKATLKSLALACSYGMIMGVMSFSYGIWEPTASESEINRFSVILAMCYGATPLFNRFFSRVFSWVRSYNFRS